MLILSIPNTTEIGDELTVTINGKDQLLELGYDTICLDGVVRPILKVEKAKDLITLYCE